MQTVDRMIRPDGCYTRAAFLAITGWSDETLRRSERDGLKLHRPPGRRSVFVLGREFIAWLTREDVAGQD